MSLDERDELIRRIEEQRHWCDIGSRVWSVMHHGTLALSALLSASAAVVAKLSSVAADSRGDLTAILAGSAALLATLAVSGGFERKWRTNRLNRGRCRRLLIEAAAPDANLAALRVELLQVIGDQDDGIVGQQGVSAASAKA